MIFPIIFYLHLMWMFNNSFLVDEIIKWYLLLIMKGFKPSNKILFEFMNLLRVYQQSFSKIICIASTMGFFEAEIMPLITSFSSKIYWQWTLRNVITTSLYFRYDLHTFSGTFCLEFIMIDVMHNRKIQILFFFYISVEDLLNWFLLLFFPRYFITLH